jgi:monosaccharide-transporting ATPase
MTQAVQEPVVALALTKVSKHFAGTTALKEVSFELRAGEVHALLGENGAGKSTLIKIMTGAYPLEQGSIELFGKRIAPRSPAQALAAGISAVYQEITLLPNLSVAQNLYLGREPRRFGVIDRRAMNGAAAELLRRFRLDVDVTRPLGDFSLAVRQLVAIARGIDLSARVLVLDEPTASLDHDEVALLFEILGELKAQGIAIVFISHFLDQVYAIADRITVLRNGERVGTFVAAELPRRELVAHMLGSELEVLAQASPTAMAARSGATSLELRQVSAVNGIHDLSLAAGAGEVLGLAGLLGAGRSEICAILFGLARRTTGSIQLEGKTVRIDSPRAAIRHALALCPEDRKDAGIFAELGIRENVVMAVQARRGWLRLLPRAEQQRLAEAAVSDLRIACPHVEKPVGELSGGNQQKVILARWLATRPQVLILDEPTRGIDIGAHAEIIKLVRRLCEQGLAVILASSSIEELIAACDRVAVLRERRLQTVLAGAGISEPNIVAAIAGELQA